MKFQTECQNDIKWLNDPSGYAVEDVVRKIQDAGKWEKFLQMQQDNNGVVDCDELYDYLQHESSSALRDVGLHFTENTATVAEVVKAWKEAHKGDGWRVSYDADGKTPTGLMLFNYGHSIGTCLEFETVDPDGKVNEESLDEDEVLELLGDKARNATVGAWTGTDPGSAVFEMWVGDE